MARRNGDLTPEDRRALGIKLINASRKCLLNKAARLINKHGADIDYLLKKVNTDGTTPLMTAVWNRHTDMVKLLIDNKADVNKVNSQGDTALSLAAAMGCIPMMELLLSNGADSMGARGWWTRGWWTLHRACQGGHLEAAKYLVEKEPVDRRGTDGRTYLLYAATLGAVEIVRFSIDMGADINFRGPEWGTALTCAAVGGHLDVVKLLVSKGADLTIVSQRGLTAVQAAAIHDHSNVVHYLVSIQFDFDENGNTVPRECACCGSKDVPRLMRCIGCKAVSYCDVECQKKNWKIRHKDLCPTFREHKNAYRREKLKLEAQKHTDIF